MLDYRSGINFDRNLIWTISDVDLTETGKHIPDIMNEGILINKVTVWLVFFLNLTTPHTIVMAHYTDEEQESVHYEDSEYESDPPEEQDSPIEEDNVPEDTNLPTQGRLSLEEVNILRANLEEWKGLKGSRRRPLTQYVRALIQKLDANEYIDAMEWNDKKKVRIYSTVD